MDLKKLSVAILVALLLPAVIFAGGQREAAVDGPVRLVWWGALPAENGPGDVVANFNAAHDHIQVEYVRYVNNAEGNARLDTSLLAGEQVDLFVSYSPAAREQRVSGGFAMELSGLMDQVGMDLVDYFGQGVAQQFIRADGSVYSIPTNRQIQVIMANKDALEEIGALPIEPGTWTWDDYRAVAEQLMNETDVEYGSFHRFEHFMVDHWVRTSLMRRNQWMSEDGKTSQWLSVPELKESLEWFYDAMHSSKIMPSLMTMISDGLSGQEASILFNKRAGMIVDGVHRMRNVRDLTEYPRDFQTIILPVPSADLSKPYAAPVVTGDEFKINANTKHPEAAMEFLNWYITEGYAPMIPHGRTPLYASYPDELVVEAIRIDATLPDGREVFDVQSFLDVVLGSYDNVIIAGPDTARAEVSSIITEELEGYLLDLQNLDTTLTNLHSRTQAALDRAN